MAQPYTIDVRQERFEPGSEHDVLVRTLRSAISAGTEMLFYRGQIPLGMAVDATIDSLQETADYPLKYGYAAVGQVVEVRSPQQQAWLDRLVFSFQPHQSHFWAHPSSLLPLPPGLEPEQGVFVPNMETAVNFLQDGRPLLGERVLVIGQGVVGLLTTALLAQFPLAQLVSLEPVARRRQVSLDLGARASLDPDDEQALRQMLADPAADPAASGADLTYELTGLPQGLNLAITYTGFAGRIVIGSWYGTKQAAVDLGGRFHRSRLRLVSSQVSSLDPRLTGRWTKGRRMATALDQIARVRPDRLITHRYPVEQAPQAYQLVDRQPDQALQVVFTYD
jgi:2-desacetyl-2-hydroxyethyl bacteriochlorophyllide A dehydrogenase